MTKPSDFKSMLKRKVSKKHLFGSKSKDKSDGKDDDQKTKKPASWRQRKQQDVQQSENDKPASTPSTSRSSLSASTSKLSTPITPATVSTSSSSRAKPKSSSANHKKSEQSSSSSSSKPEESQSHRILRSMDTLFASPTPQAKNKIGGNKNKKKEEDGDEVADGDKKDKDKSQSKPRRQSSSSSKFGNMSSSKLARSMKDLEGVNISSHKNSTHSRKPASSRSLSMSSRSLMSHSSASSMGSDFELDDDGMNDTDNISVSKSISDKSATSAATTTNTSFKRSAVTRTKSMDSSNSSLSNHLNAGRTNRRQNLVRNMSSDLASMSSESDFSFSKFSTGTDVDKMKTKKTSDSKLAMMSQSMSNLGGGSTTLPRRGSYKTTTTKSARQTTDNDDDDGAKQLSQSMRGFGTDTSSTAGTSFAERRQQRLSQSDHGRNVNGGGGRRSSLTRSRSADNDNIIPQTIKEERETDSPIKRTGGGTQPPPPKLRTSADWIAQRFGTTRKSKSTFNTSSSSLRGSARRLHIEEDDNDQGMDKPVKPGRKRGQEDDLAEPKPSAAPVRSKSLDNSLSMDKSLANLFGGGGGIVRQGIDASTHSTDSTWDDGISLSSGTSRTRSISRHFQDESEGSKKPSDTTRSVGDDSRCRSITRSVSLHSKKPNSHRTSANWIAQRERQDDKNKASSMSKSMRNLGETSQASISSNDSNARPSSARSLTRNKSLPAQLVPVTRRSSWVDQKVAPRQDGDELENEHMRSSRSLGHSSGKAQQDDPDKKSTSVRNLKGVFEKTCDRRGSTKKLGGSLPGWMSGDEFITEKSKPHTDASIKKSPTRGATKSPAQDSSPEKFVFPTRTISTSRRIPEPSRVRRSTRSSRTGLVVMERTKQLAKRVDDTKAKALKAKQFRPPVHQGRLPYRSRLKNLREMKKASSRVAPAKEESKREASKDENRSHRSLRETTTKEPDKSEKDDEVTKEKRRQRAPIRTLTGLSRQPQRRGKVELSKSSRSLRRSKEEPDSGLTKLKRKESVTKKERPRRQIHRVNQKQRPVRAPQRRKVDMKPTSRSVDAISSRSSRSKSGFEKSQTETPVRLVDKRKPRKPVTVVSRRRRRDHTHDRTKRASSVDHDSHASTRKESSSSNRPRPRSKRHLHIFPKLPEGEHDPDIADAEASGRAPGSRNRLFHMDRPNEELDDSTPMEKREMGNRSRRNMEDSVDFSDTDSQHSSKRVFHFEDPHASLTGAAGLNKVEMRRFGKINSITDAPNIAEVFNSSVSSKSKSRTFVLDSHQAEIEESTAREKKEMQNSFGRLPPVSESSQIQGKAPARKHNFFQAIPVPRLPEICDDDVWLDDDEDAEKIKLNTESVDKSKQLPYQIVVRRWDGESFNVIAISTDYVEVLKFRIQSLTGISAENQRLSFQGKPVDEALNLKDQNIVEGSILFLDPMKIHIQADGRKFTLVVKPEDTIEKVKDLASNAGVTGMDDKCLVFGGADLRNNRTLSECNIGHDDVLIIENFEVSVMHWSGVRFVLPYVHSGNTVGEVKAMIFQMKDIPISQQRISCNGKPTSDGLRLRDQRIKHKSILVLALPDAELESPESSRISTAIDGTASFRHVYDEENIDPVILDYFDDQKRFDGDIEITVLHWSGEPIIFNGVRSSESIHDMKQKIFDAKEIDQDTYRLRFLGRPVDDNTSLRSQKIGNRSILTMELLDTKLVTEVPGVTKHNFGVLSIGTSRKITIVVRHWNGEMFSIEADSTEYIDDVKDKILETKLVPLRHQRLTFNGKPIDDASTLQELKITHLSTLSMEPLKIRVKVRGGEELELPVDLEFTISQIKQIVAQRIAGARAESQLISLGRQELGDDVILSQCDIDHGEVLSMELFEIKALHWTGISIPLAGIGPGNTVHDVKDVISLQLGEAKDLYRLSLNGRLLDEAKTLKDQLIKHNSVLVMQSLQKSHEVQPLSAQPKFKLSILPKTGASAKSIRISIKHWKGDLFVLDCNPNDYITDVKEKICEHRDIPVEHQRLSFNGRDVGDEYTLLEQRIENHSTLVLEPLQVHIQMLPSGNEVTIPIELDYTIEKVKKLVVEASGITVANPCISSGGMELLDGQTLQETSVDHDDTLTMESFSINALHWTGQKVSLPNIGPNNTIEDVKDVLLDVLELSKTQYQLTLHGRVLKEKSDGKTLRDHGIHHKTILVVQDIQKMEFLSPTPTPTSEKKKSKFQLSFFPKVLTTPRMPNIAKATAAVSFGSGGGKITTPSLSDDRSSKRKSRSFVAIFTSPRAGGKDSGGGGSTFDNGGSYAGFEDEDSSEFNASLNMSNNTLPLGPVL